METIKKKVVNTNFSKIKSRYFFVKTEGSFSRVRLRDILFISSKGQDSLISMRDKTILINSSLNKIHGQLRIFGFAKCHKNYVIQITKIDIVDSNNNKLITQERVIPIGRKYKKDFMQKLNRIK